MNDRRILLKLYENLMLARSVNKTLVFLSKEKKIRYAVFSEVGQEAGGVGICSFLRKDDYLIPSYRDYSYVISKGMPLNGIFAEYYGKRTGSCGGFGGGFRFFCPSRGIVGSSVSLGANFSITVGIGLAIKKKNKRSICVSVFGDGAASRGTFHGAMNISALWKLPILWVCVNNQYSMTTHVSRIHSVTDISRKVDGYGIYRRIADGNDVIKIHETCRDLIERLRSGKGPVFLELKTYRSETHRVGSAVNSSGSREEIERWRNRDPLKVCEIILAEKGILNKRLKEAIIGRANSLIKKSLKLAEKSSSPSVRKILDLDSIYA